MLSGALTAWLQSAGLILRASVPPTASLQLPETLSLMTSDALRCASPHGLDLISGRHTTFSAHRSSSMICHDTPCSYTCPYSKIIFWIRQEMLLYPEAMHLKPAAILAGACLPLARWLRLLRQPDPAQLCCWTIGRLTWQRSSKPLLPAAA